MLILITSLKLVEASHIKKQYFLTFTILKFARESGQKTCKYEIKHARNVSTSDVISI